MTTHLQIFTHPTSFSCIYDAYISLRDNTFAYYSDDIYIYIAEEKIIIMEFDGEKVSLSLDELTIRLKACLFHRLVQAITSFAR